MLTVQTCGENVIVSEARQSRWRKGALRDRRVCYAVEIATAQAPRNDDLLNSEQLRLMLVRISGRGRSPRRTESWFE